MATFNNHIPSKFSGAKKLKSVFKTTGDLFFNNTLIPQTNYATSEQKYILWFFRLLATFLILMIVLLFTVHINDTVSFTEGEIISSNPQIDWKAPFEAQLLKINVKEGQKINSGDTLMIIYNESNNREYTKQKAEQDYLEKKLASVQSLLAELDKKKNEVSVESNINSSKYNLDIQNIINNIQTLDKQYNLQQQKLATANEKNTADSILYHKDMLSKLEYNSDKDVTNDLLESINSTGSEMQKQQAQKEISANDFLKEQQTLKLKRIELEENQQNLIQLQIDMQNELIKANENLKLLNQELAKQYIIARTQGVINFIYNAKQSSNLINKGDLLLSISPNKNNFYAKAIIPEKDIQYVGTSMLAHLKLDAYYHLEYGILKGKVTYVSARKEDGKFYALIQLENANNFSLKSDYTITGEIITERMTLIGYFIKKLFKELDKKAP